MTHSLLITGKGGQELQEGVMAHLGFPCYQRPSFMPAPSPLTPKNARLIEVSPKGWHFPSLRSKRENPQNATASLQKTRLAGLNP